MVDQDLDGYPGITVVLTGTVFGEVYVAQRITTTYRSEAVTDNSVDGLVSFTDEQKILGATEPVLAEPNPSSPDPDKERSYFMTRRIDDGADCAWVLENAEALFGAPL